MKWLCAIFLILNFSFPTSGQGVEIPRRRALQGMAAFFGGLAGGGGKVQSSTPIPPSLRPTKLAEAYDHLEGVSSADEDLFYLARFNPSAIESFRADIAQLQSDYRTAILELREMESHVNSNSLKTARRQIRSRADIQDKYENGFRASAWHAEQTIATKTGLSEEGVASAVHWVLNPESMIEDSLKSKAEVVPYSDYLHRIFVEQAFQYSPPLALKAALNLRTSATDFRSALLKTLDIHDTPGWTQGYFRFTFEKAVNLYDKSAQGNLKELSEHYILAIKKMNFAKIHLSKIEASQLRDAALSAVHQLDTELRFELETLPQRLHAWSINAASIPWSSRDWMMVERTGALAETAISALEWESFLNLTAVAVGVATPLFSGETLLPETVISEECEILLLPAPSQESVLFEFELPVEQEAVPISR